MGEEDIKHYKGKVYYRAAFFISLLFNLLFLGGSWRIEALSSLRAIIILATGGIFFALGYFVFHKKPASDVYEIIKRVKLKKKQEDIDYSNLETEEILPRKWALYLPNENLLLGYDIEKDKVFTERRGKNIDEYKKEIEESKLKTDLIKKEEARRGKDIEMGIKEDE